jgi:hypothetical protein
VRWAAAIPGRSQCAPSGRNLICHVSTGRPGPRATGVPLGGRPQVDQHARSSLSRAARDAIGSTFFHFVLDAKIRIAERVAAQPLISIATDASTRVTRTIRARSDFRRFACVNAQERANQSVENHRAIGRSMMMNERIQIGGDGDQRAASGVDEKLVVLHRRLKRIANARAHLDLQEAEALREAQRLQLWRQFGHTSLADYMVNELGYSSHRVAEDRLRVANALPALPALTAAIQNGNINFSQAKELVRVATPDTEKVWIEKAQDMNVREVEQAVAGHCKGDLPDDPIDPRLVRKTLYLSVRPETEVLFREVRQALDRERGEKLDDDAVLEAVCRAYLGALCTRASGAEPGSTIAEPTTMRSTTKGTSSTNADERPTAAQCDETSGNRTTKGAQNESSSHPRLCSGVRVKRGAPPAELHGSREQLPLMSLAEEKVTVCLSRLFALSQ